MPEQQGDFPEPPDYDAIEERGWKENAARVLDELSSGDPYMSRRIETFSVRFGYGRDEIVAKIASDEMFAAHFSKEPRRQGIHEKAAAEWLEQLRDVENFEILPKSGRNAWYITGDGELRQGKRKHSGSSKSLDFRWRTGSYKIFAAHKFTKEGGGGQDNQFLEVRNLLEIFQKGSEEDDIILLVIVDGPYFTEAKMNDLHRFEREKPPMSKALSIGEVPEFLEEL